MKSSEEIAKSPYYQIEIFRIEFWRIFKIFCESNICNYKTFGISKNGFKKIMDGEVNSLNDICKVSAVIGITPKITFN